jgi:enterochelin esterase-like enzyme
VKWIRVVAAAGTVALVASSVVWASPRPVDPQATSAGLHGTVVKRNFWSYALQRKEHALVYLPPGYASAAGRRYPLIVFLHGVPGQPEDFVAEGFVARMDALVASRQVAPFVAVFPAGSAQPADDNEWADSAKVPDQRWETYVTQDVLRFAERWYSLTPGRSGRAVAGMSMGGFGAMNIALHSRDTFAAAASWSGYFNANTPDVHDPDTAEGRAYSPMYYASRMNPSLRVSHPALSFYVGAGDWFAAENAAFDRELTRLRVPHAYRVIAGAGHDWSLWVSQVSREVTFLRQSLK